MFIPCMCCGREFYCLCLYRVCVVDENYPMIGLGGYVIPVAIEYALRVSLVINALSVLGGT